MHRTPTASVRRRTALLAPALAPVAALGLAGAGATTSPAVASAPAAGGRRTTVVVPRARAADWAPVTPAKWAFAGRDVVLVWNHTSPTRFHYVHLSQDNTIYPHNGIFRVDDADRVRIDDQWDGVLGAPPAIDDTDWHRVLLSVDVRTGRIAVRLDGAREPFLTATDRTFTGGRIGFGSFDNRATARWTS